MSNFIKQILTPKTLSEFYQSVVHIIYSIVFASSFDIFARHFIPIQDKLNPEGYVQGAGLFLAYFIAITGWIAYYKSTKERPHKGKIGNLRFGLDLIIIFLFFYLINLADPINSKNYGDTFHFMPIIFLAFMIWDILKFLEYKNDVSKRPTIMQSIIVVIFYSISLIISLIYYNASQNIPSETLFWINGLFMIPTFFMYYQFRSIKWDPVRKL